MLSAVPALDGLTARYFKILKDFLPAAKKKRKKNAISTHNGNLSPMAFSFSLSPGGKHLTGEQK